MNILILGLAFLFGAILAQFLKAYILAPVCALIALAVIISPYQGQHALIGSFGEIVMLNVSVQIGYFAALVFSAVPPGTWHFREPAPRGFPVRSSGAGSSRSPRGRNSAGYNLNRNSSAAPSLATPGKREPAA